VFERGVSLSVGQKQLISMLRTLVYNPKIIIMDEATSSIDPESERIIQHAIEKLIEKRTSIIIAHRLSTIKHANRIYVVEKGKIIESGSHTELLNIPEGKFRQLYEKQEVNQPK
jgi:ATP-binding cassette subfamily B protein